MQDPTRYLNAHTRAARRFSCTAANPETFKEFSRPHCTPVQGWHSIATMTEPIHHPSWRQGRRAARALLAVTTALLLSSCGGGVYLGWEDTGYYDDDYPPSVSIVTSQTVASAGSTVRLSAAAADDYAVSRVEFYRLDAAGRATWLGSDSFAPYQWDTTLPDSADNLVRYQVRAIDDIGQFTDSAVVTVTLQR
jgi:uncharacterized protein YjiS (DUF1127 family)